MDTSKVSLMPDTELATAAKSGAPGIPSWLAAAELQKRQNIRSSAPKPGPQGTVVDNLVSKTLQNIGMQPGAPQAQMQAPVQPQMNPQQPRSYSHGGIVDHYAAGGSTGIKGGSPAFTGTDTGSVPYDPNGIVSGLESSGWVSPISTITPDSVSYTPGVTPEVGTLEQAAGKVSNLYGPGPDFAQELAELKANQQKNGTGKYGVGDYLQTLVAGILSGGPDAVAGFGKGLGQAQKEEQAQRQQNFQNGIINSQARNAITNQMTQRQRDIAQGAESFYNTNAQIADAQAREKAELAAGNANRSTSAQEENARLAQEHAAAIERGIQAVSGNVNTAAALKLQALQNNDTKTAGYMDQIIHGINQRNQQAADQQWQYQKKAADYSFAQQKELERMKEQAELDKVKATQGSVENLDSMAQNIYDYNQDPSDIKRLKGPEQAYVSDKLRKLGDQNGQQWNETFYKPIQDARKQAFSGNMGQRLQSVGTAAQHLSVLADLGENLNNTDVQALNKVKNSFSTEFGGTAPTSFDGVKQLVAGEIGKVLKPGGTVTQDEIKEISKQLDRAKTPDQLNDVINKSIQVMGGAVGTIKNQFKSVPGIRKNDPIFNQLNFSPQGEAALYHRGFDPRNLDLGQITEGLPAGNGKPLTPESFKPFAEKAKAAGLGQEDAMRWAYSFGWR